MSNTILHRSTIQSLNININKEFLIHCSKYLKQRWEKIQKNKK